jgi:CubicO group peptidase (beta-lactamase class C family)
MMTPDERLMAGGEDLGETHALLVVRNGAVVLEHYADGVAPDTTLKSWSMAKSILHATVGILVSQGRLLPNAPAAVPEWANAGDPRGEITLWDLLQMRSGLAWNEDYLDGASSDVIEMLFARDWEPVADTGGFAASKSLVAQPGTRFNYSSGTSNIVARIVRDQVGEGDSCRRWLQDNLFGPLGVASADPRFDDVGTWIGSSYCFCTARDFARFGELYLNGGRVAGTQVLDPAWVATASRGTGIDDTGAVHTAHWWLLASNPWGAYRASGYEGQYLIVVPPLEMVVVRLGRSDAALGDNVTRALCSLIASLAHQ